MLENGVYYTTLTQWYLHYHVPVAQEYHGYYKQGYCFYSKFRPIVRRVR